MSVLNNNVFEEEVVGLARRGSWCRLGVKVRVRCVKGVGIQVKSEILQPIYSRSPLLEDCPQALLVNIFGRLLWYHIRFHSRAFPSHVIGSLSNLK